MCSAFWMVGSDVATTCTSRMAMNMPMHIMAKPAQVAGDTLAAAVSEIGCSCKGGVLRFYAYKKHNAV